MAAQMIRPWMMAAQEHKTGNNNQSHDAAPEHDFSGLIMFRGKLDANAHAPKQEACNDHP